MYELPPFDSDGLRFIAICIHIEPGSLDLGEDKYATGVVGKIGDEPLLARKIVDVDTDASHYHIEVGLESAFPGSEESDELNKDVGEILLLPPSLAGRKIVATNYARFRVARSDLRGDGVVTALNDVSLSSGTYEFTVRGCTLDVAGPGPIKQVQWWPSSDSGIGVELNAYSELELDDRLLVRAHTVLLSELEQLVARKKG